MNIIAALISHGMLEKDAKDLLKQKLGPIYMQILSVGTEDIIASYWRQEPANFKESNFLQSLQIENSPFVLSYLTKRFPIVPDSVSDIEA